MIVKHFRSQPYARPLSIMISVSAAIIIGNVIREGSVSFGQALGIVLAITVLVCIFWLGEQLLRKVGGSSNG